MMATNSRRSRDVRCPFYLSDKPVAINCEAPCDGCVRVQLLFNDKREIAVFMRQFCNNEYQRCLVYTMIFNAKYADYE